MKKTIATVAAGAVLLLSVVPSLAKSENAKGPAEKATGEVGGAPRGWRAEFSAHEEYGGKDAKGEMKTWSDQVGRELIYKIKYVQVDQNTAWFAALCTYDSSISDNREGRWLLVKVLDDGEPGYEVDNFGWNWIGTDNYQAEDWVNKMSSAAPGNHWWLVKNGNLQVHTY